MEINKQNYESYFLLYIDNELTASQKKEVAMFIAENPEYEKTLIQLQETILAPEEIQFEDKMLLYRFEEMEASLAPSFKQSLYRRETKVIEGFFSVQQNRYAIAVAALFFLFIGYQWIGSENKNIETGKLLTHTSNSNKGASVDNNSIKLSATTYQNAQDNSIDKKSIAYTNSQNIDQQNSAQLVVDSHFEPAINQITPTLQITEQTEASSPAENVIAPANTTPVILTSVNNSANNNSESFENVNTDNSDRTIYVANFEIDGEKLRGIGRRFNALLKRNKTEKEK